MLFMSIYLFTYCWLRLLFEFRDEILATGADEQNLMPQIKCYNIAALLGRFILTQLSKTEMLVTIIGTLYVM